MSIIVMYLQLYNDAIHTMRCGTGLSAGILPKAISHRPSKWLSDGYGLLRTIQASSLISALNSGLYWIWQ